MFERRNCSSMITVNVSVKKARLQGSQGWFRYWFDANLFQPILRKFLSLFNISIIFYYVFLTIWYYLSTIRLPSDFIYAFLIVNSLQAFSLFSFIRMKRRKILSIWSNPFGKLASSWIISTLLVPDNPPSWRNCFPVRNTTVQTRPCCSYQFFMNALYPVLRL